jgi:uncharacterized repeat protein (TIGR03803 family)
VIKPNWGKKVFAASLLLCAATATALPAQTFTILHTFNSSKDGDNPLGALLQASDGNLYGTTESGFRLGGTVFRITPSGIFKTIYAFCKQSHCTDGSQPFDGLVQTVDGNFYGTTMNGGAAFYYGVVFRMTPTGSFTTLYSFCTHSGCADGKEPEAGLVEGTDGNFYGTTIAGGAHDGGTVFKITPDGSLTRLYSFCSQPACADGAEPEVVLVEGTDGNFYGTTDGGGVYTCHRQGCGTVFKITPGGALTTLYSFCSESACADGDFPQTALVQASDGNFYGTTAGGGTGGPCLIGFGPGCGTVFKITPSGTLTTLYSFCSESDCADGQFPHGLIQATDGNLYGTTEEGGANTCVIGSKNYGCGTIFRITPTGTLTTLYSFCSQSGCSDGEGPVAGLVQDTNGKFYGTTVGYGTSVNGTAFSLSVGLGPFVESQPAVGTVGMAVNILGNDLTGATGVTFNGTAATFRVVSASAISTTVPAGATSGTVQVVTPSGTLSSNVNFRVLP